VTHSLTAIHANATRLNTGTENVKHTVNTGSFFSSVHLLEILHTKAMNTCGTVKNRRLRIDRKIKLKFSDIG